IRHLRRDMWGGLHEAAVMDIIVSGELDERPYNLTSLAADLKVSRSAATRIVEGLERRGYVVRVRQRQSVGRSVVLRPTQLALKKKFGAQGRVTVRMVLALVDRLRSIRA